jgi:hypothetical protein
LNRSRAGFHERGPGERAGELPGYFTGSRADVRHTREHKEKIGETVEIDDDKSRDLYLLLEVDHSPLRAAANCPGDVEGGTLPAAAGNDERLERLELPFALVDGVLESLDATPVDVSLGEVAVHLLQIRSSEERPDAEEIALHGDEDLVDAGQWLDRASHTEDGVQLVDVAIGFDAWIVFLDPTAAKETRCAVVAGFRIDPHASKSTQ